MKVLTVVITDYEAEALRRFARKTTLPEAPLSLDALAGFARRCMVDYLISESLLTKEALYNEIDTEAELVAEARKAEAALILAERKRAEAAEVVVVPVGKKTAKKTTKKRKVEPLQVERPVDQLSIPLEAYGGNQTAGFALWQLLLVESFAAGKWLSISVGGASEKTRRKEKTIYTAITKLVADGWLVDAGRDGGVTFYTFSHNARLWLLHNQGELVDQGIIEAVRVAEDLPPL